MEKTNYINYDQYRCYFCRYFESERGRWGNCQLLNVSVKSNLAACSVFTPVFKKSA